MQVLDESITETNTHNMPGTADELCFDALYCLQAQTPLRLKIGWGQGRDKELLGESRFRDVRDFV